MFELGMLAMAAVQIPKSFLAAISRAVVPLILGIFCAGVAGGFYAVFLADQGIGGFFSSAAGIATGVLIALIVNGLARDPATSVDPDIRTGTVALAAVGLFSALVGELITGGAALRGILFALVWGGMMAGVLGLVFFLRAAAEAPVDVTESPDLGRLLGLLSETGSGTVPSSDKSGSND